MQVVALFLTYFLALLSTVSAVKFNVEAKPQGAQPRCIRDFVTKDTLVVTSIKTKGSPNDGQNLNVFIVDNKGNEYSRKKNLMDKVTFTFTAHDDAAFDICFENTLTGRSHNQLSRPIELNVEIGADARDWNAIQAAEKLKPTEAELRRINDVTDELRRELEYLRAREMRLRDTNESTNHRVKLFSVGIIFALLAVGGWQIYYLRTYFRSKHII